MDLRDVEARLLQPDGSTIVVRLKDLRYEALTDLRPPPDITTIPLKFTVTSVEAPRYWQRRQVYLDRKAKRWRAELAREWFAVLSGECPGIVPG